VTAPVVGIVGAGQLARMTSQAAISLAVVTRVLARDPSDPACLTCTTFEIGDPGEFETLESFSRGCDVVTFDHEQVDPALVDELEALGRQVHPSGRVLRFSDKAHQRVEFAARGIPVPEFVIATTAAEVVSFGDVHGWPVVAKVAVGGYDGRGVFVLDGPDQAETLMGRLEARRVVVEPMLAIEAEISVVVARRTSGACVSYPVVETRQVDGICVETITPASIDPEVADRATALARRVAESIGATGILAVELFVTDDGLVVNELAPRPHNSGHWTIEGAVTSQFENHLRGVLDWPLGDTSLVAPAVATVNVLGTNSHDPIQHLPAALAVEGARVHLYAKAVREGRKLGHVTATGPEPEVALRRARAAVEALGVPLTPPSKALTSKNGVLS